MTADLRHEHLSITGALTVASMINGPCQCRSEGDPSRVRPGSYSPATLACSPQRCATRWYE